MTAVRRASAAVRCPGNRRPAPGRRDPSPRSSRWTWCRRRWCGRRRGRWRRQGRGRRGCAGSRGRGTVFRTAVRRSRSGCRAGGVPSARRAPRCLCGRGGRYGSACIAGHLGVRPSGIRPGPAMRTGLAVRPGPAGHPGPAVRSSLAVRPGVPVCPSPAIRPSGGDGGPVRTSRCPVRPVLLRPLRRGRARRTRRAPGARSTRGACRTRRPRPDPQMPLPIRRSSQGGVRGSGRGLQAQRGFPDAQQGAGAQGCGAFVEVGAVDGGAVGGAQVGDGDRAVRFDRYGAVQTGDVGVVQGDVGVGGAADADLAAVQQVYAAGVGAGDDAEACGAVGQAVCGGGARGLEGEHRAVDERGFAERRALGVEAFGPGVQHDGAAAAARAADVRTRAGHGGGEGAGHRRQGGPGRGRDQHIAGPCGVAAARPEDGQPDLHRRQRSLLPGSGRGPARSPHHTRARRHVQVPSARRDKGRPPPPLRAGCILAPATDNAPADRRSVILIGLLRAKKCLLARRDRPDFDCRGQLGRSPAGPRAGTVRTVRGHRPHRPGAAAGPPGPAGNHPPRTHVFPTSPHRPPDRKDCATALQWGGRAARR